MNFKIVNSLEHNAYPANGQTVFIHVPSGVIKTTVIDEGKSSSKVDTHHLGLVSRNSVYQLSRPMLAMEYDDFVKQYSSRRRSITICLKNYSDLQAPVSAGSSNLEYFTTNPSIGIGLYTYHNNQMIVGRSDVYMSDGTVNVNNIENYVEEPGVWAVKSNVNGKITI